MAVLAATLVPACADRCGSSGGQGKPRPAEPATRRGDAGNSDRLGPLAIEVAPIERAERTRLWDGRRLTFRQGGITSAPPQLRALYRSRGITYVGVKSRAQVGEADCLIDWRVVLVDSAGGRGQPIGGAQELFAGRAGATVDLSSLIPLSEDELARVSSARAGTWTLCGAGLEPLVTPLAVTITDIAREQRVLPGPGSHPLPHTALSVTGHFDRPRCHMSLMVEELSADGFALSRDVADYSLAGGATGRAAIPSSDLLSGRPEDFRHLATAIRARAAELSCPSAAPEARLDGLRVTSAELVPATGPPRTSQQLSQVGFSHRVVVRSRLDRDCSFLLRYRVLDRSGLPLSRAPVRSETLHLRAGQRAEHATEVPDIFVWPEQVDEIGRLEVSLAMPIDDCRDFDPALVPPG